MAMKTGTGAFRKSVMKTVSIKPVKLGLRTVSKSTNRANILHATVSLKANVGKLVQALNQYILGAQFSQEMGQNAFPVMGNIGYDLTILCRALKVKMPSATKKAKLVGTRTAALLHLDALTTDLLTVVEKGTFAGPQMIKVKKMVVLPNKAGAKEEREVETVDATAEAAAENERQEKMKSLLAGVVDLYWRLSYDMFKQPPSVLFIDKLTRMHQEFPAVSFKTEKVTDEAPVMVAQ